MSDGPKLHIRCIKHHAPWWTPGKLYPVNDDGTVTDSDEIERNRLFWYAEMLVLGAPDRFQLVWLLPDGTELEALE